MSDKQLAVAINDLKFAYDRRKPPVLELPELRIAVGEKVFLQGASGSGKTTLLGLISGILEPTAGRLSVLGQDYAALRGLARDRFRGAHLGYIFQMFNLIPYLNVIENICLPCKISQARRQRVPGDLNDAANVLAARLGISQIIGQQVTGLSVGQQQRVAAARALLGSPDLVIADEPTSALDWDHREAFIKLLFEEADRSGSTVLFVSHDRSLAQLFTRILPLAEVNHVCM